MFPARHRTDGMAMIINNGTHTMHVYNWDYFFIIITIIIIIILIEIRRVHNTFHKFSYTRGAFLL